ncbi:aldehyde dehydrogenase [Punctularia strigosozonata HHB-11173 SS5]|uniref:Aldehyde dehydrogenase n=1 Tax=Punctularia strigosozonata (strain HHB-11173) TaxID=741275 RepID=R7S3Y5_PUNST|nr:aldehyde dehydrogenase [Punctularia strigosozonata HHB-11173 SS5]EIN03946.1 aldehyde dehydrogenase [Punctularia strigosozonata HHB-11173 SS5]
MTQLKHTAMEDLPKDVGKPRLEVAASEVGANVRRAVMNANLVATWAKPELIEVPDWQKSWRPTINKTPKGTVLIIAPWNYPAGLLIGPLIGAIAAGCCAVLKPSEYAPHWANLVVDLLPRYLDASAYRVVNGAVQETTKDHIEGNSRVARIVASAAAKHLTPCTLELGGKSPAIIDPACDLNLAARRIFYGKCLNAGQICVSPDYVLIPEQIQDEFASALRAQYDSFYPEGSALESNSMARIVSGVHFARLRALLNSTKGDIFFGGKTREEDLRFEPTVVKNVPGDIWTDPSHRHCSSIEEAIQFVNSRPYPLVLYAFTNNPELQKQIIDRTMSGTLAFNDTIQQLSVSELPFGGVGESGYGYQIGRYTFDTFTHMRSTVDIPACAEAGFKLRYPPYTDENLQAMKAAVDTDIPADD